MTSFKSYKKCPNCGTVLPKPSLDRIEDRVPFSIYQSLNATASGLSTIGKTTETPSKNRFVKTMEFAGVGTDAPPAHFELDLSAPAHSSVDFELDLSEADIVTGELPPLAATTAKTFVGSIGEDLDIEVADGEIEVEGLGFEPSELDVSADISIADQEAHIELTVDVPEAEVALSDEADFQLEQEKVTGSTLALELDEPEAPSLSLDLDGPEHTEFSLETEELEAESALSLDLDGPEHTEFSLEAEEPEAESALSLDLDGPEHTEFSLEAEEPEAESALSLDLDGPEHTEFSLEAEEPEAESVLALDLDGPEHIEFSLEVEEPEAESALALDLGSPLEPEIGEEEPLVEFEDLDLKHDFSLPDDAESDPRSRIPSLDLNYDVPLLVEEHPADPRSQIESLDLGYEPPVLQEEPPIDPRSQIESLELSLETEAHPPTEPIEIPEPIVDGIKLELETDDDRDDPPPDKEKSR